ncbi:hypothetical protein LJR016_004323 [Devosia sp. LjRoot16]|uniref:hypothetical protein n=1 Tax=Devosia sp. LjRoot16 TaxID=3342271 RepID=UPI003ED03B33
MQAVANAIARARSGLDWSYPCLIWIADYVRDATGTDYAFDWRAVQWDETTAKRALARLAAGGNGSTAVERAIDVMARALGWAEVDGNRQGAVLIGVFDADDGVGVPAIFDGENRWIISNDGEGVTVTGVLPKRMWEIVP